MIYLSLPYSYNPEESFRIANEVTKELLLEGEIVFSPVSQMHILSKSMDEKDVNNHDFWMSKEIPILKMCDKLVVVVIESEGGLNLIKKSKGCQEEIEEADINSINTIYRTYKEESSKKKQVGGSHYKSKTIQPIEYIQANDLNFCEGNIVKYITRYKEKNGLEDLEKTGQYLDFLIEDYKKKI